MPPRFYLPEHDVRMDALQRGDAETSCPYKGTTSRYYTVEAGGERLKNVAWAYAEVNPKVRGVEGLIAFSNEKVDLEVDGQPWERPQTPFF